MFGSHLYGGIPQEHIEFLLYVLVIYYITSFDTNKYYNMFDFHNKIYIY